MNIFMISHSDFDYDGRLRELYKVFSKLGNLYTITKGSVAQDTNHRLYQGGYLGFIAAAIKYGSSLDKIDLLVLDNRKSVIPGLILRVLKRPGLMIQDCRELYDIKHVEHLAGKIGCVIEKWGIKRADIIICANLERAQIMQEVFHLTRMPVVYENLRQLQYSDESAIQQQQEKFARYVHEDEFRIISSSGCSTSRTNDVLVQNLDSVVRNCRLFLVGSSPEKDRQVIEKLIAEKKLNNVEILDQLNQDELKYLISVCHIGIVNYHQKDTNNKLCASGKVYEFIYEGIPVVTTTNPPLKRMCDENGIGCSDDHYFEGINKVLSNYTQYQENVRRFAAENPVEANNERLLQELKVLISQLC